VAVAPLRPGELVGRLPTSLVIASQVARASPEGRLLAAYEDLCAKTGTTFAATCADYWHAAGSTKPRQAPIDLAAALMVDLQWTPFPSRWYLYLFVAAERAKGAASAWAPYLASAPHTFDDPLWFTPAERALLKGTNLDAALVLDERQLETLYSATFPGIYEAGLAEATTLFPLAAFSRKHVQWARSLYSSRCFPRTISRMHATSIRDEWLTCLPKHSNVLLSAQHPWCESIWLRQPQSPCRPMPTTAAVCCRCWTCSTTASRARLRGSPRATLSSFKSTSPSTPARRLAMTSADRQHSRMSLVLTKTAGLPLRVARTGV